MDNQNVLIDKGDTVEILVSIPKSTYCQLKVEADSKEQLISDYITDILIHEGNIVAVSADDFDWEED